MKKIRNRENGVVEDRRHSYRGFYLLHLSIELLHLKIVAEFVFIQLPLKVIKGPRAAIWEPPKRTFSPGKSEPATVTSPVTISMQLNYVMLIFRD